MNWTEMIVRQLKVERREGRTMLTFPQQEVAESR